MGTNYYLEVGAKSVLDYKKYEPLYMKKFLWMGICIIYNA